MSKLQKRMIGVTAACWLIYTAATLLGIHQIYNVFSPLTGLASIVLILLSLKQIGKYRIPAVFVMLGIGVWVLSDFMLFAYTYFWIDDPVLMRLSDLMYLFPNFFFGLSLTAYIVIGFHKRDLIRLILDTILLAIFVAVLYHKLLQLIQDSLSMEAFDLTLSLGYLIVVTYMLIMMFLLLTLQGVFEHSRAGFLLLGALAVYNIFELRYCYMNFCGEDAESIYIDIVYMACVCILGVAACDPTVSHLGQRSAGEKGSKIHLRDHSRLAWLLGLVPALLVLLGYLLGFLSVTEFALLLFSCLSYLFMWKTRQSYELTADLLKKEKEENHKLGEWVDYQNQEIRVANEQLEKVAYKDSLTGLYNRKYSRLYIKQLRLDNKDVSYALYSMDINYFKPINDNYGLEAGDKVLAEVAGRLRELENEKLQAFRVGGDEFLLVYRDFGEEEKLQALAERLKETMDRPLEIGENVIRISMSIGVASCPKDAGEGDQLLRYADSARRLIKHRHGKTECKFYDSGLLKQMSRRRRLELKLQAADYDRDFRLYYQPQVESTTGKLIGMEALIRWIDPEDGFISPGEFIPLAEEMGLMANIGAWVNRTAMKQIRTWNESYKRELVVGVNVSPLQLRDPEFAEKFLEQQKEAGVPSQWVDVEITEGYALNSTIASEDIIAKLKESGFTFSVDDFGTGYASFNSMLDFTFDRIKIAKELVDDLESNHNAYVVVKVIIMMAEGLNLQTIAEGVETKEQLDILCELGCGQIQGYYFGKPLPAAEFEEKWLKGADDEDSDHK